ncbi:MAG: immunity 49 family protein [Gemmatimonadetes bacterium]|nr:immunity 49 family protein [Gemmatimonadota bacterium]
MTDLHTLVDGEFAVPFFGFSLTLAPGWRLHEAAASGGSARFVFRRDAGDGYLNVHVYARDYRAMALYFEDELARQRRFPERVALPFGEAFESRSASSRNMIFQANGVIFSVACGGNDPAARAAGDAMLRGLRLFAPVATQVPPKLQAFKYLHPGVSTPRPKTARDPELARAELEARIAAHRDRAEKARAALGQIPPERHALAHLTSGSDLLDVAVCSLLLRRGDDARAAFGDAARSLLAADAGRPDGLPPEPRLHALAAALLSGERELPREAAQRLAPPAERRGKIWTQEHFARALAALVLGDDDAARAAAAELLRAGDAAAERDGFYPGTDAACRAILDRDATALAGALAEVLERHAALAKRSRRNQPDGWLCFPAAALAVLAAGRGLDVAIEPKRRRAEVKLRAVFAEPHRGMEAGLEVDFVPLELLRQAQPAGGGRRPSQEPGSVL